jgi:hypothetical protein
MTAYELGNVLLSLNKENGCCDVYAESGDTYRFVTGIELVDFDLHLLTEREQE